VRTGGGAAQGGEAGAQGPPPALLRVGREVERQALNPGAGGEGGLQVRDLGREVREVEGRKEGVLLIALGLTDHGVRAVLWS
jgi:hypothetical protein